ncbi:hypothetical protein Tco_0032802 [Tanacetum coccineum]
MKSAVETRALACLRIPSVSLVCELWLPFSIGGVFVEELESIIALIRASGVIVVLVCVVRRVLATLILVTGCLMRFMIDNTHLRRELEIGGEVGGVDTHMLEVSQNPLCSVEGIMELERALIISKLQWLVVFNVSARVVVINRLCFLRWEKQLNSRCQT